MHHVGRAAGACDVAVIGQQDRPVAEGLGMGDGFLYRLDLEDEIGTPLPGHVHELIEQHLAGRAIVVGHDDGVHADEGDVGEWKAAEHRGVENRARGFRRDRFVHNVLHRLARGCLLIEMGQHRQ